MYQMYPYKWSESLYNYRGYITPLFGVYLPSIWGEQSFYVPNKLNLPAGVLDFGVWSPGVGSVVEKAMLIVSKSPKDRLVEALPYMAELHGL